MSSRGLGAWREALAVFAVLLVGLVSAGLGYTAGSASAPDLASARAEGQKGGQQRGAAQGRKLGYRDGLRAGRRAARRRSYRAAFESACRREIAARATVADADLACQP